ncbi:MAG: aspartate-semialdehyde dehydrogenase [Myxococcales bacterium]|nr:aspartate-semialdehyde dehydrogenase [Myxococcales bacterium]MDD9969999.1 aspartate-semialdehyde dehydrogenase [Myxococcales bacterium]
MIGWRGMVGSVLMDRMRACGDFGDIEPTFFSTSNAGGKAPSVAGASPGRLQDAFNLDALMQLPVLVSCQGGDYTDKVHDALRGRGWTGYWIDAASKLRMRSESVLVLDPVNAHVIARGLSEGCKTFCGANCTVSLMLMALQGLFRAGHVEWVTSMTYQAASGAGAQHMRELIAQMAHVAAGCEDLLADPASTALEVDARVGGALREEALPTAAFGVPLAGSALPWIDVPSGSGRTREEAKAHEEGNKLLGLEPSPIPIDGICVRIGSMRCHAQAFTIKLRQDLPLDEVEEIVATANDWVRLVPNDREATLRELTPARVSGQLEVPIGRLHKLRMGGEYLTGFSVGDQLLWGAAEPLRRMLQLLKESERVPS